MVGCLKYVSTGKWSIKEFKKVFKRKKEIGMRSTGTILWLYLKNIRY